MTTTSELVLEDTHVPAPAALVASPPAALPVTRIRPARGWQLIDLGELWRYRELLFFLVWRDVKIRYRQTVLGVAWAVLQPLMMMLPPKATPLDLFM